MSRSFISIVLVFSAFGSHCHQAPATARHYEVGSVYNYDYVLGLELNEPNPGSNISVNSEVKTGSTVGYKVLSQVQITTVWQNDGSGSILKIQLVKPKLQIKSRTAPTPEGFRDHTSHLDKVTLNPLYVHWKNGIIEQTYSVVEDETSLANIKKGIANLLQFHQSPGKSVSENTPMGQCSVHYTTAQDSRNFQKTITDPCNLTTANKFFNHSRTSATLGSETQSKVSVKIMLTKDNAFVEEAEVEEVHVIRVTAKREVGATIQASQSFKLTGTSTSSDNSVAGATPDAAFKALENIHQLSQDSLVPKPENIPFCETTTCKGIDVLVKSLQSEKMASIKMASAFLQLATRLRETSQEEIAKLFAQNKQTAVPPLLDVCAATGTLGAHRAAMGVLDFNQEENIENTERYLLGLSLSSSPPAEAVEDLFALIKKKVKSEKLQETLILTSAAIVHTLRAKTSGSPSVGTDFENYIIESLDKCPADNLECPKLYLRAMKNLKSKKTLPKLFEILQKSNPKVAVVSMKAIHAMPDSYFDPKVHRPILVKIVTQLGKKHDSSTRTLAIDILLRNHPTKEEVMEILHMLKKSDNQHAEVTTFLWHRIHEFMETNPKLGEYLTEFVNKEDLKNYHHLSPKGLSTAFSRVFTANPHANSTFSNAIEMTGKILKRSSFDVYIQSKADVVQPLSLGIFASGLGSIASDNEVATDESDDEDATAGMELSLMGVQMRPIVFFVGKGELMGMVWSGAGSERTTALQGNVFLQDDKKQIPLFSGLVAEINIQGGLSFDLAGQIQLSLWHRTANSLVENNAGMVLQSVIRADTSFVRSRIDYTLAAEAALHFTSDINFYDGVIMCLKLTQPEFIVKQNIHKIERIPGSKHRLRKAKYKTIPNPGITYALNKKNSQLCGVMYKDEL